MTCKEERVLGRKTRDLGSSLGPAADALCDLGQVSEDIVCPFSIPSPVQGGRGHKETSDLLPAVKELAVNSQ